MGLFNRETKEEKQTNEMEKLIEKYQLEDLDENDLKVLKKIEDDLIGCDYPNKGNRVFVTMKGDHVKINYLDALVQQNWMIIRQLGRLNKNIKKLSDK